MLAGLLFLLLFLLGWSLAALVGWLAVSLPRRARGALWTAPFTWLGAVGGGVLVPLLGWNDAWAIAGSMAAALVSALFTGWLGGRVWDRYRLDRRFAKWARRSGPAGRR